MSMVYPEEKCGILVGVEDPEIATRYYVSVINELNSRGFLPDVILLLCSKLYYEGVDLETPDDYFAASERIARCIRGYIKYEMMNYDLFLVGVVSEKFSKPASFNIFRDACWGIDKKVEPVNINLNFPKNQTEGLYSNQESVMQFVEAIS